jgi:hypothetical protein
MKITATTTTGDAGKFKTTFSRARLLVDRAPVFASPNYEWYSPIRRGPGWWWRPRVVGCPTLRKEREGWGTRPFS